MSDENELLFDELYEKTKDCGRVQFIKLLMQKEREIQELKEKVKELSKWDKNKDSRNSRQRIANKNLLKKINELKKQLEVGEQQYNDLLEEKENLQEQLSIKNLQLEEMKLSKRDYTQENILEMKLTLKENQQKEFIEYLTCYIDALKNQEESVEGLDIGEEHILMTLEEVLSKYQEIIGVLNEN